jgi:2-oxoglutarate ferredoxin oxidoreductase subunit alpha
MDVKILPKYEGLCIQAEDELAAVNMAIGASFAGVKAMTATSGPGLSLMSESIGLASMAEIPLVVVDVQRVGPSTGIPTKTEQGDLQQALYGGHGDAPRIVIAPADVEDCFDVTVQAFYISEKYQIPVIILSDQFIAQRKETVRKEGLFLDENGFKKRSTRKIPSQEEQNDYKRYMFIPGGVSPMSYPGLPGATYQAAGIEHDEYGYPNSDVTVHEKMNEKRFAKFKLIREELDFVRTYGDSEAELGIIAWGSSKGAVKEAVLKANKNGMRVSAVIPQIIYPFPTEKFTEYLKPVKRLIIVEVSFSGHFRRYLRSFIRFGPRELIAFARSGGASLTVEEIYNKIVEEY